MANALKDKVQSRLEALNISPFEAAARMGKSRTYVYDIIKGNKTSVRGASLDALADALETTSTWLMSGDDSEPPAPRPNTSGTPVAVPTLHVHAA
jgi:transcriptional regulator with XRE-family HTH domain